MSYIAKIDKNACSAHGDCVDIAPEVFALGDVAEVIGERSRQEDPQGRRGVSCPGNRGDRLGDRRDDLPVSRPRS